MNITYLRNITKPFRKIQAQHFTLLLLINLFSVSLAYLMGKIVDSLASYGSLLSLISFIICLKLGDSYLKYRRVLLEKNAQLKMHNILGRSIPEKLSRIPYHLFEDAELQDLFHFINKGPERILLQSLFNLNQIVTLLIQTLIIFLLLSRVSHYLLAILPFCLIMIVVMDFKGIKYYNQMHYEQSRKWREEAYYRGLLNNRDDFYGLKTKKALSYIANKLKVLQEQILREKFMIVLKKERYFFFSMTFIVLALTSVLSFLLINLSRGKTSLGLAVLTLLLVPNLLATIEMVGYLLTFLGENIGILQKHHDFQNIEEIQFEDKNIESLKSGFSITFDHVWFKYPNSTDWIIKDMSFKIEQGDKLGLVGKNGSGKSTLMNLILGLYRAQKGRIYLNEISIDTLTYKDLSQLISVVFQDFHHYELSLQDQFKGHKFEEVNVFDRIAENEEQFETINIGRSLEKGIELSGGQWQKISLTRALLSENPVLILDEPTSAIDPISEKNLYSDFSQLIDSKTTSIMVSHRMNSLKTCNKIMIIDQGRLLGLDTHENLMKENVLYNKMYLSQLKWYEEDKRAE